MSRCTFSLIVPVALVFAVVIACGCTTATMTPAAGNIKKFSSPDDIREYIRNNTQLAQDSYYSTDGVYVFGVTPETGFVLSGTVEHGTGGSGYYWYGSSENEVKRSLYIDNILYTLSPKQILINSLSDINTTIKTITLPGSRDDVLYPGVRVIK